MVQLSNVFYREEFESVPFGKRLLLLPHCLRDQKECQGDYDQVQLVCKGCGSCILADFRKKGEELGYTILIAEGTPVVIRILLEHDLEGVLGVSCLDSMEKAFKRVQESGIPCIGVPLLVDGCKDTKVDDAEVLKQVEVISPNAKAKARKRNIDKLASSVFLKALQTYPEPKTTTEEIAKEYLLAGGKRIRPFLSIAVYSTLTKEEDIPQDVYNVALAIEMFHKASLIHDDLEDNSLIRYNIPTLHVKYNPGVAINIGDFMLGLGYLLLTNISEHLGPEIQARVIRTISNAHKCMGLGQGKELLWDLERGTEVCRDDILEIYENKTSQAYIASIVTGALMADASVDLVKVLEEYSMAFGVAFQIHDDLDDISLNVDGSFRSCPDIDNAKPTLLLALALEALGSADRKRLLRLFKKKKRSKKDCEAIYELFVKAGAVEKAREIMEDYSSRADSLLEKVEEKPLRNVLKKVKERALEEKG
jgi:geranylgeranyl pyrophosphate synthase